MTETIKSIPLDELHPFPDHPFGVRDDDAMQQTVESIKEYGVLVPAIARPREDGGYEIIAGHRRKHACQLAGLLTMIVGPMFSGACKSEKKREKLKAKMQKKGAVGDGDKSLEFAGDFIDNMQTLHPKTITRQFYSDYITPLEDDISADGTTVHIIYAKQMGEKYYQRYIKHFQVPDIHEFDMKHEVWLYDDKWHQPVLDCVCRCMEE